MKVVKITQKRAPSELSYALDEETDVFTFVDAWQRQNPDQIIGAQSMPMADMRGWSKDDMIPVEYP